MSSFASLNSVRYEYAELLKTIKNPEKSNINVIPSFDQLSKNGEQQLKFIHALAIMPDAPFKNGNEAKMIFESSMELFSNIFREIERTSKSSKLEPEPLRVLMNTAKGLIINKWNTRHGSDLALPYQEIWIVPAEDHPQVPHVSD